MRKNKESTVVSLQGIEDSNTIHFRWVGNPSKVIGYLVGGICSVLKDTTSDDEENLQNNCEAIKRLVYETMKMC